MLKYNISARVQRFALYGFHAASTAGQIGAGSFK